MIAPLLEMTLYTFQQRLTCTADAAAQNHYFRIDYTADIGNELAHVGINLLQNVLSQLITAVCCVEYILSHDFLYAAQRRRCVGFCQRQLGQSCNAGSRAVLLHTAALAAAADSGFVTVKNHMTDLTGCAGNTVQRLAVQNNAAADTGTQSDSR